MAIANVRAATRSTAVDVDYREVIHAFGEVAAGGGHVRDMDELLHAIAGKLCELLGVSRASVYLRDERGCFRGQIGHAGSDIDARVKRLVAGVESDRFTREIVASKRPVVVSNVLDDPRPIRSTMREWGVVSMLGIPMIAHDEVIGILFVDDVEHAHVFSSGVCEVGLAFAELAAVAIEQAQGAARLRASVEKVIRQNQRLRRAAELDDRLAALAADGVSARGIVEAIADLTAKPVSFHDSAGNRRALASAGGGDGMVPRLLDPAFNEHPEVREALAKLDRSRAAIVAPILGAGLGHRHLLVPVKTAERLHGHLVVMEAGSRLSSLDVHVAGRAARILALELSAEQRAAAAESDIRASLLSDLVRGERDADALRRRGDFLGVDLDTPHVFCLLAGLPSSEQATPPAAVLLDALADLGHDVPVLSTTVSAGTAAILPIDASLSPRSAIVAVKSAIHDALVRAGAEAGLAVGLSSAVTTPGGYIQAAVEAEQVLRCVERLAGADGPWLLSADDLGAGRLMLASVGTDEAERFARDALGPMCEETEPMSDLLSTLQVFFESSRSVRGSAVVLDVHENTIRYRLARIHELTGLDVASNSDHQMTAQIALRVLQLQGRRPWRLVDEPLSAEESVAGSESRVMAAVGA
jgi:sugar diacid utilization regulator